MSQIVKSRWSCVRKSLFLSRSCQMFGYFIKYPLKTQHGQQMCYHLNCELLFWTKDPPHSQKITDVTTVLAGHVKTWTCKQSGLFFSIIFTFTKQSVSQQPADKETHSEGGKEGSHVSVPIFMSLHSWWHQLPVSCCRHTIKCGSFVFEYSSLCVCQ